MRKSPFYRVFMMPFMLMICFSQVRSETDLRFLDIGIGVRPFSTALADDITATYWNPAGLSVNYDSRELYLSHLIWIGGMYNEYVGYTQPIARIGKFGITFQYFSSGSITVTKEEESDPLKAASGDYGDFSENNMVVQLTYARSFWNGRFHSGVSLKWISMSMAGYSVYGPGLDLGIIYRIILLPDTRFGFTIKELGFLSDRSVLPLSLRAGISSQMARGFILSVDVAKLYARDLNLCLGLEKIFDFIPFFNFRILSGISSNQRRFFTGLSGFNCGIILSFRKGRLNPEIGYSLNSYGALGLTHNFSLNLKW